MIDIIGNVQVKNLWTYLSSYYEFLSDDQKKPIEDYWKALMDGLEAQYFNLSESYLSSSLTYSKGYIEDRYMEIETIFADLDVVPIKDAVFNSVDVQNAGTANVHLEYYVTISQHIKGVKHETAATNKLIVGLPNSLYAGGNAVTLGIKPQELSKDCEFHIYCKVLGEDYYREIDMSVNGVDGDEVSGWTIRDTGLYLPEILTSLNQVNNTIKYYIYDLDNKYFHLYIPTLTRVLTDEQLEVDVDYKLLNFKQLGIYPNDSYNMYEKFIIPLDIKLAPIFNTILKNLFRGSTLSLSNLLESGAYSSYITYSGITQETKNRAQHLMKLSHAIILKMRQGLSINRLSNIISLYHNVPFAYEGGTVEAGTSHGAYKIGNYEYIIPSELSLAITVGDVVNKFDLLCSGCSVDDYISMPYVISGLAQDREFYYTVGVNVPTEIKNLNYFKPYVDYGITLSGQFLPYSVDTQNLTNDSKLLKNILPPGLIYKYYGEEDLPPTPPPYTEYALDMSSWKYGNNIQFSNGWTRVDSRPYSHYSIVDSYGIKAFNIESANVGYKYAAWNAPALCKNLEFEFKVMAAVPSQAGGTFAGLGVRTAVGFPGRSFYFIGLRSATEHPDLGGGNINQRLSISKVINDTETALIESPYGWTEGTWYTIKGTVINSTLQAKIWESLSNEPEEWMISITDTTLISEGAVIFVNNGSWWDTNISNINFRDLYVKKYN